MLYTLSEKHVLAAINPKDGSIVWRQHLKDHVNRLPALESFLKATKTENTIITAIGGTVNAWDAADGKLVWEWETTGTVMGLEVLDIEGSKKDLILLVEENGKGLIRRLGAADGQLVWEHTDER